MYRYTSKPFKKPRHHLVTQAKNCLRRQHFFLPAVQRWRTGGRARKRLGQTRGSGAKPQRMGFGAAAPGLSPYRANFFIKRRAMTILHCGLVRVAKKSYREVHTKKLPLRERTTKTPRKPANSTGKWRRPNKGGALASAFKSRTTPCPPLAAVPCYYIELRPSR
jgi:hypothetical protein